ncbi:predicted protein [Methanosarcina acetivorans C2A]|uniref:Uncharacterized protein n=1 Tax=Methanosarcina acetivorans (strain ATCC 35395 / DSM 2834 / JCM 12185 / C2A) TaxID=188937 RepID=Q8TM40_METAC|nr:predicted protein [Methanosarcina acetivorans C2A]
MFSPCELIFHYKSISCLEKLKSKRLSKPESKARKFCRFASLAWSLSTFSRVRKEISPVETAKAFRENSPKLLQQPWQGLVPASMAVEEAYPPSPLSISHPLFLLSSYVERKSVPRLIPSCIFN